LFLNLSVYDQHLFRVNVTIRDNATLTLKYQNYSGNLSVSDLWYNITETFNITDHNNWTEGAYYLEVQATDSHTRRDFIEQIKTRTGMEGSNNIKTYELSKGDIKFTYPKELRLNEYKYKDRFILEHESDLPLGWTHIDLEAKSMLYLPESEFDCHFIINDAYWYDCEGLKTPSVEKITDNHYRITYLMDKTSYFTKSIGGLNNVTIIVPFSINTTNINVSLLNISNGALITGVNSTITILNLDNNQSQSYTSISGTANFTDIPGGNYSITATATGYNDRTVTQFITTGKTNFVNISLVTTAETVEIIYYIKSSADTTPLEDVTVELYRKIGASFSLEDTKSSDFVGAVVFDQEEGVIYLLNLSLTGYVSKSTNEFEAYTSLSPYLIFLDPVTVVDFVETNVYYYQILPRSNILTNINQLFQFNVGQRSDRPTGSNVTSFRLSSVINGTLYADTQSPPTASANFLANLGNLTSGDTVEITYLINYVYEGTPYLTELSKIYYYNPYNDTTNISFYDTLTQLSDDIDNTQNNSNAIKIGITVLFIALLIFVLSRTGMDIYYATGIGMLLLIPAYLTGFLGQTGNVLDDIFFIFANVVYWTYIVVFKRD
jgi:hypothetical protein